MIEPIRLSFEVACPAGHAFDVWTNRIGQWWPADHTASGETDTTVVLEGRAGGRIFERTATGIEHDWGEVTVWEPPTRLGYLWHLRRDRADATQVEIQFIDRGDSTQVEIVHSGWEAPRGRGRVLARPKLRRLVDVVTAFRRRRDPLARFPAPRLQQNR